jgi:hypothetical protein
MEVVNGLFAPRFTHYDREPVLLVEEGHIVVVFGDHQDVAVSRQQRKHGGRDLTAGEDTSWGRHRNKATGRGIPARRPARGTRVHLPD